jgi:hypothetical protein
MTARAWTEAPSSESLVKKNSISWAATQSTWDARRSVTSSGRVAGGRGARCDVAAFEWVLEWTEALWTRVRVGVVLRGREGVRGRNGEGDRHGGSPWVSREPAEGDAVMSLAGADRSETVGMGVVSGRGIGRRRVVVVVGMALLR